MKNRRREKNMQCWLNEEISNRGEKKGNKIIIK